MKKILLFVLLFPCGNRFSYGSIEATTEEARKNAHLVVTACSNYIEGKSYLLLSVLDTKYIVIIKKGNKFEQFYVENDSVGIYVSGKEEIKGCKKLLKGAFDKDNYHRGYIDLNSPFYSDDNYYSTGNMTYFFFKNTDDEEIYGESLLTTVISRTPINIDLYHWLLARLIYYPK